MENQNGPMQDSQEAPEAQEIFNEVKRLAPSVKPWIPAYQLIHSLQKQKDCNFLLKCQVEDALVSKMPVVGHFRNRLGTDRISIVSCCDEQGSIEAAVSEASLIVTSDKAFFERVQQDQQNGKSNAHVQLVRPRKLTAFDGIQDLIDLKELPFTRDDATPAIFEPLVSKKFISQESLQQEVQALPEFTDWGHHLHMQPPLCLEGAIVKGFGRGSRQLGVPTANLEMSDANKQKTAALVPGVYAAKAFLTLPDSSEEKEFLSAMSIGWNPVFDNAEKTIEAYLIHDFAGEEFYGAQMKLEIVSFVRAEALFGDFDSLIHAIQCDIQSVIDTLQGQESKQK